MASYDVGSNTFAENVGEERRAHGNAGGGGQAPAGGARRAAAPPPQVLQIDPQIYGSLRTSTRTGIGQCLLTLNCSHGRAEEEKEIQRSSRTRSQ